MLTFMLMLLLLLMLMLSLDLLLWLTKNLSLLILSPLGLDRAVWNPDKGLGIITRTLGAAGLTLSASRLGEIADETALAACPTGLGSAGKHSGQKRPIRGNEGAGVVLGGDRESWWSRKSSKIFGRLEEV